MVTVDGPPHILPTLGKGERASGLSRLDCVAIPIAGVVRSRRPDDKVVTVALKCRAMKGCPQPQAVSNGHAALRRPRSKAAVTAAVATYIQ